jgi:hypothetical protein
MIQVYFLGFILLSNITFAGDNLAKVDFSRLLKNPQMYDGKIVEITGFANIEFEGNALYLDQKSQNEATYEKGLWLEISKTSFEQKKYNGSKILIRGTFKLSNKGHMNLWKGAIEQVTKLVIVKKQLKKEK